MNCFYQNRDEHLRLFNGSILSVTHRADIQALFTFTITLLEELFHDKRYPATVNIQRFGRIAQISAVHHVLKHLQRRRGKKQQSRNRTRQYEMKHLILLYCIYCHLSW